jgi:hypothetical protein
VKVVHRSSARAYFEPVSRLKRRRKKSLCIAHGVNKGKFLGKASGNRRGQRTSRAVAVPRWNARRGQSRT